MIITEPLERATATDDARSAQSLFEAANAAVAEGNSANAQAYFEAATGAAIDAPHELVDKIYHSYAKFLLDGGQRQRAFICQWARHCLTQNWPDRVDRFAEAACDEIARELRIEKEEDRTIPRDWLALAMLTTKRADDWMALAKRALQASEPLVAAIALWRFDVAGGVNSLVHLRRGEVLLAFEFFPAAIIQLNLALHGGEKHERIIGAIDRAVSKLDAATAHAAAKLLVSHHPGSARMLELGAIYSAEFVEPRVAIARLEACREHAARPARLAVALANAYKRVRDYKQGARWLVEAMRVANERDLVDFVAIQKELIRAGQGRVAREALVRGVALDDAQCLGEIINHAEQAARAAPSARPRKRLPIALVSQVQRSGGTLLSRLFDGHPQLWAHPHEITIGKPMKWNWVDLSLQDSPRDWFRQLFQARMPAFQASGYVKSDGNSAAEAHEFRFSIEQQAQLFFKDMQASPPRTPRDILDAYFTSFFRAWRDAASEESAEWITGFTPRLSMDNLGLSRFGRDYPDSLIIACIRDPYSWFASASRHGPEYRDPEQALNLWRLSTLSALMLADRAPDRTHLLTYEDLVSDTEREMRLLANRMQIEFATSMLEPTFAGESTQPNSSFRIEETGVHAQSVTPGDRLSAAERELIAHHVGTLYDDARSIIARRRQKRANRRV